MKMDAMLLRSMWKGIEEGNEETTQIAADYVNKISKTANSRMKKLEDIGYDFYDYDRAYTVLQDWNRKRFKTNWTVQSIQENYEQFREFSNAAKVFVEARTTPTEIAKRSTKRANWLLETVIDRERATFPEDFSNERMDRYQRLLNPRSETERKNRREFERLISSGPISDLVSYGYGNTDETVDSAIYAIEKGAKASEINNALDTYIEGLQLSNNKMYIEDLWKVLRNNKWQSK